MAAFLRECWDLLVYVIGTSPAGVWPLVLAFVGSALITQRVKFWIPFNWPGRVREALAQATAFWSAVAIVWLLWPTRSGLIAGVCIGIASPVLYAITVRAVGMRWPWLRDLLSQDVRG